MWQTPARGQLLALTLSALVLCSLSMLHSINVKTLFVAPDQALLLQQGLLALLTLGLVVFFMRLAERIAQRHVLACRDTLFRAMLNTSPSGEPKRLGVAMNRLITDANSLRQWAGPGIAHLLAGAMLTGFYSLYFVIEVPHLLPVSVTLLLLLALHAGLSFKAITGTEAQVRSQRGRLSGHLSERSVQKTAVRRMRRQTAEADKSHHYGSVLADLLVRLQTLTTLFHTALMTAISLVTLAYIWAHLSQPERILELLHLPLFAQGILLIHRAWQAFLIYKVAYKRLSLALIRCRVPPAAKGTKRPPKGAFGIALRGCKVSPDGHSLQGRFPARARILLTGTYDKTGLIRVLLNEQRPRAGYACLDKRRVINLTPRHLYKRTLVLDEQFAFFKSSVRRNIVYGQGRIDDVRLAQVCAFLSLARHQLEVKTPEMGRGLSAHWQVRIMLARTLLAAPGLLIIDHPLLLTHPLARHLLPRLLELIDTTVIVVGEEGHSPLECEWVIDTNTGFCGPALERQTSRCLPATP